MSQVRVKVKLTFPESEVRRAVLATMVRQFDVEPNIRRADVEEHRGWIVCEVDGAAAQVEAALDWLRARGDHGGPAGGRPRGLIAFQGGPPRGPSRAQTARAGPGSGARPAGRGDLARLVEDATLGTRERQRLVGVDLAALEPVPAGRRPHHVVAAILVDGHSPFWPSRQAR